jgi:hypothetical protein
MKTNDKASKISLPRLFNIGAVSGILMRSVLVTISGIVLMATSQTGAVLIDLEPFNVDESFDKSEIDIYVEVTEDDGQVRFEFHNESIMDSTVASIYFEDGVLDGIADFEFTSDTLFEETKKPGNLPASNTFVTAYSADAIPPAPFKGIGIGDQLTIIMNLDAGATFEVLVGQINDNSLRIGIHVIALPDGSSFSAVSVPEPSTVAILGIGSLFLIKRKKKAA